MAESSQNDVTRVLDAVAAGDESATARLLPLIYEELRRLARSRMAKLPIGQTLQPTALVHEAYLRVLDGRVPEAGWGGRAHFFFAAARAMRDILVEQARSKSSQKRGGAAGRIGLDDADISIEAPDGDVLGVNEALAELERDDPETARVVLLRYFSGLTNEEVADVLQVSIPTVERRWRFARAWLRRALAAENE